MGRHPVNDVRILPAFAGYGIELEYMIVDRDTLSVLPIADALLRRAAGYDTAEVKQGETVWSNELMLHLIELKNLRPVPTLDHLPGIFQGEIGAINQSLEPMGARLMPSAMHPWMDSRTESRLWPHRYAEIYRAFDRIFDCRQHGWANLQSMHLNLPFANDEEFARLHAAIRLVLPILPALAASSPIADAQDSGFMDFRMQNYCFHESRVPSLLGQIIPDTVQSMAEYRDRIFTAMYQDIAPYDPEGVLHHEWLNSRGVIPRFERNAMEIRVIDMQECPQADLALAAATVAAVRALYDMQWSVLSEQSAISTDVLAAILLACICDADQAIVDNAEYLRLMGYSGNRCRADELWHHLIESVWRDYPEQRMPWQKPLDTILQQGPLARRIMRAVNGDTSRFRLQAVYRELCECLAHGCLFEP